MSSYTSFIQAALLAAQQGNSSLTAPIHTFTGYGPRSCHDVETLKVSTRPVQIAQGEGRQVEGREEFKEIKERQRRCEISTNAKSQQKLLKEGFKERHYAQDRIDQAEKKAVAQNHGEQAETESTETKVRRRSFRYRTAFSNPTSACKLAGMDFRVVAHFLSLFCFSVSEPVSLLFRFCLLRTTA